MSESKQLATLCAHAGADPDREPGTPFVTPIAQTTLFYLGQSADADALFSGARPGYSYTRFGNPTVDALAKALAQLEGGADALITSSGNAASLCAVTMALRGKDDKVVVAHDVYGGTTEILRVLTNRFGVPVEALDFSQPEKWRAAVAKATVVYVETPSNPLLRLVDIAQVCEAAHAAGAKVIIDNTVATPMNQQPLLLGADFVVHSVSKYLNGHSDLIAGAVVSRASLTAEQRSVHKNLGGTVNAIDAWLALRGLRTFALRMEAHNRNGQAVAEWLAAHPAVKRVHFPGLKGHPQEALYKKQMKAAGALLSFELKGGAPAADRFLDRIRLVVHAVSLGGMESLATRPALTSHRGMTPEQRAAAGVDDGLIRLSVGTEALQDILDDLAGALS